VAGKTRFRGEVVSAGAADVVVAVDGHELTIPVETIVRGNLIDEDGS
jgi:ribosome maturation factor RimP